MAVGIARAEGLLDLGDSVLTHLDHLASATSAGVEQITIQHLLTMSSGVIYRWEDPDSDHPDDPARDILSAPLGAAPGSCFAYRGANTYLLSRVIHACSGQDLRDYLVPRLFTPLGIQEPQWLRCPRGYSLGAVGLHLRTEELARLTRVLLDHRRWSDQPIVPADYVDGMIATPCRPMATSPPEPPRHTRTTRGTAVTSGCAPATTRGVWRHRPAEPPRLHHRDRPLPWPDHGHSGRHLDRSRARDQLAPQSVPRRRASGVIAERSRR
jgi:CubicO group peptidase (beta-lactamase class C family)